MALQKSYSEPLPSEIQQTTPQFLSMIDNLGDIDGAVIDSQGKIYIVARTDVLIFDLEWNFLKKISLSSSWGERYPDPRGIAVDQSGNIYVVNGNGHSVTKFDPSGTMITKFGSPGHADGQFTFPSGIATDILGNVYVADTGNYRVQKFDSSGNLLSKIDGLGTLSHIKVDSKGNIYVGNQFYPDVKKFDSNGTLLFAFKAHGDDIAFDSSDNVYLLDVVSKVIQKYNSDGNFTLSFGSPGSDCGQFSSVSNIAITTSDRIYAFERNNRVQVFENSDQKITPLQTNCKQITERINKFESVSFYDKILSSIRSERTNPGQTNYQYVSVLVKRGTGNPADVEITTNSNLSALENTMLNVHTATELKMVLDPPIITAKLPVKEIASLADYDYVIGIGDIGLASKITTYNDGQMPKLNYKNNSYDIPFTLTNGYVTNLDKREDDALVIGIFPFDSGNIKISFPRELIDPIDLYGKLQIMLSDRGTSYNDVEVDCNYKTVSINFTKGSREILLRGEFASFIPEALPLSNALDRDIIPVDFEGKKFEILTRSQGAICNMEFNHAEKKIGFILKGVRGTDTTFDVTIPQDLLSGVFSVIIDSNNTVFQVNTNEDSSTLSFNIDFPSNERKIEIFGTRAIPEFPIAILVLITSTILVLAVKRTKIFFT